jgi:hypothetical protein
LLRQRAPFPPCEDHEHAIVLARFRDFPCRTRRCCTTSAHQGRRWSPVVIGWRQRNDSLRVSRALRELFFRRDELLPGWGGRIIRPGRASPLRGHPQGTNTTDNLRAPGHGTRLITLIDGSSPKGVILPVVTRPQNLEPFSNRRIARAEKRLVTRWQDYSARTGLTPSGPPAGR